MKIIKKILLLTVIFSFIAVILKIVTGLTNVLKLKKSLPLYLHKKFKLDEHSNITLENIDCKLSFFKKNTMSLTIVMSESIEIEQDKIKEEVLNYIYEYYPIFKNTKIELAVNKSVD